MHARLHPFPFPRIIDIIITYDEAASFLKNSPSLEPCPEFAKICTLCKHVIKALSQLFCPQSAMHGWPGLAVDPAIYLLLEGTTLVLPTDPRATGVYPQWAAPTTAKMIVDTYFFIANTIRILIQANIRGCIREF